MRSKNGCVCTGTKFSEVCLEGQYCMAEALERWEDDEPLSLCQTKCDAEVSPGSTVSTACARKMEGLRRVTPATTADARPWSYDVDDQYLLGPDLLVAPVTTQRVASMV